MHVAMSGPTRENLISIDFATGSQVGANGTVEFWELFIDPTRTNSTGLYRAIEIGPWEQVRWEYATCVEAEPLVTYENDIYSAYDDGSVKFKHGESAQDHPFMSEAEIAALKPYATPRKITCIKTIRDSRQCGLSEAKHFLDFCIGTEKRYNAWGAPEDSTASIPINFPAPSRPECTEPWSANPANCNCKDCIQFRRDSNPE